MPLMVTGGFRSRQAMQAALESLKQMQKDFPDSRWIEQALALRGLLEQLPMMAERRVIVVREAQALKNPGARQTRAVKQLDANGNGAVDPDELDACPGLKAVVWADVIQLAVYVAGGIAALGIAWHLAGGVGASLSLAGAAGRSTGWPNDSGLTWGMIRTPVKKSRRRSYSSCRAFLRSRT